jgi:hypothetical protein
MKKNEVKENIERHASHRCFYCGKKFKTKKGLLIHQSKCKTFKFYHLKKILIKKNNFKKLFNIFETYFIPSIRYSQEFLKFAYNGEVGILFGMRLILEEDFFS